MLADGNPANFLNQIEIGLSASEAASILTVLFSDHGAENTAQKADDRPACSALLGILHSHVA